MQFGFDHDLPGDYCSLESENEKFRAFIAKICFEFEPGDSKNYYKWWKKLKLSRENAVRDMIKQDKCSTPVQEKMDEGSNCKSFSRSYLNSISSNRNRIRNEGR